MKITTQHVLIVLGILLLGMMACLPIALVGLTQEGRNPQDAQATQFAATVQALVTQQAPTQVIPTQVIPTQVIPTQVIPPTAIPPTRTPISHCYWVEFIKDITIPDGTILAPNEGFVKTWRLKNRGTCDWGADTRLVFTSGSQMSGPTVVELPYYVASGETVDVSVVLTAPEKPGRYVGYWMLRSPAGTLFGYGDAADNAFYVDITSRGELPHGTVTGSFCYPSEFNPPLILYFEKVSTGEVIQFSIPENRPTFSVLLPNGSYYAYAWAPGYNLEGAYVNPDRTMKSFVVRGGQTTSGISICDWDVNHHSRGQ